MERCPNCRARVNETEYCRRCGMALDTLLTLEKEAKRHIRRALEHLLNDQPVAAIAALQRARSLKADSFTAHLLRFASGLVRVVGNHS